jgi:signal transduction histidine kinase/PleD family two-component response regulator
VIQSVLSAAVGGELDLIFPGDSLLAKLMRGRDWSRTALGTPETWPTHLRAALRQCLTSAFPLCVLYGPEWIVLYNDACIPFLGERRHPRVLGGPAREGFDAIWPALEPALEGVRRSGEATFERELALLPGMFANLYIGPIAAETGAVDGVLVRFADSTEDVLRARRAATVRALSRIDEPTSAGACERAAAILAAELPFAAIYLVDASDRPTLAATAGLARDAALLRALVAPEGALATVLATREPTEFAVELKRALALPLPAADRARLAAVLVAGIGTGTHRAFLEELAAPVTAALVVATARETERRLAELERTHAGGPTRWRATGPRATILWAHEDAGVRGWVRRVLEEHWDVIAVEDGSAALAAAFAAQPDLILADTALPRIDGIALVEQLRRDPRTRSIPIILLSSGDDWRGDPAVHADDYLPKPFSKRELHARIRTHLALARKESLLAETQRVARLGSWSIDVATRAVTWSDELYRLLGLAPDGSATEFTAEARAHPDDRGLLAAAVATAITTPQPFEVSWRATLGDGSIRYMHTRGQVECDAAGMATRVFGYMQDVTQRVLAERALIEAQRSLAAELADMARLQDVSTQLVRSGEDGRALLDEILDAAIAITAADMGSIQLHHAESDELRIFAHRGLSPGYIARFAVVNGGGSACSVAIRTGARVIVEDTTAYPAFASHLEILGEAGVAAVQATPLVSRTGKCLGVLSTHYRAPRRPANRDLHVVDLLARQAADWVERQVVRREREQLLERERRAREEAERATRLKDDFLATLSHELREPLSAIIGWTELMRGQADRAQIERGIEIIARSARAQSQLVAELIDLSKIITGKLRLDIAPVWLPEVIEAAVDTVRPAAHAGGVALDCAIEPLAEPVHGDTARLQQIVGNLLSNAVKFTPAGGRVMVALERRPAHFAITVRDTGKGIQPAFLPHVFERFRQEDASAAREHGGLGIGLALVRELTELHGGHVTASSDGPGRGSTFTVALPLAAMHEASAAAAQARAPALAAGDLAGVRALVVDNEPDGLEVLLRILRDRGVDVVPARSTEEALAILGRAEFDVLLSDIAMPKRDGYELIAEVRRRRISTPAVAVTAFARSEDHARALEAGFQRYIAKPIEPAELLATVASLAGRVAPR